MPKRTLNDRALRALKPARPGKRYEIADTVTPGLAVRVTDKGQRTFVLIGRFPGAPKNPNSGAPNPTRRSLGEYGEITLEAARAKARHWLELIKKGRDPRDVEEAGRRAEQIKRANTFTAVCEDFIREKLPSERKGREVERDLRRDFLPRLGGQAISEITAADVIPIIKQRKATAPAQARNLLGTIKRVFAWAADQQCYGITTSPLATIKPVSIVGEKATNHRVLDDDEIVALFRVARRMGYPHGPVYQLLLLTGLRLNEVADAAWPEIDLRQRVWVIPAERMKGKNTKARPHAVPLTSELLAIVEKLPRFNRGKFLFSTTFGEKPVWMTDKVKQRLDARMLRTLKAIAKRRGDEAPALKHWTNHDIRRTVRTRLSRLKISEEAREAVLAHVRPGIKGAYDWHDYFDEKREALELWAAQLRDIVQPPPPNVVPIKTQAS